ncbi:DUF881 domain-containing protein [Nocardioides mangrovi]|uniref:DUF881 domain-containing protein n=1 Tax=Nocardioides mangrovi TaxID=2874580 RepID=A0ABS7UBQ5_9ACTN|nr:DUF881 domain-containing protein [Nocardioides mangrovi]MBZ5738212.1 DUF881 domain-containing protein [Nocardioides mangrovi]
MTAGSHATSPHGRPRDRRRNVWRIGTPVVVLLCGGLFVVSAANSDGSDLRPGRYTDLASLVKDEADQYDALRAQVASLNSQVGALTATMNDRDVARARHRVERLKDPAGLVERQGSGIRITLSDAPEDVINSTTGDVNRLLVHQQDIQAVVNALWKGGATAVTIAGQRVVSTTGIRCEGNSVQLQGVPYPQPYVIEAVGDQGSLLTSIEDDSYVSAYREDAADPSVAVGWKLELEDLVVAPAYDGLLDLTYAQPLTGGAAAGSSS